MVVHCPPETTTSDCSALTLTKYVPIDVLAKSGTSIVVLPLEEIPALATIFSRRETPRATELTPTNSMRPEPEACTVTLKQSTEVRRLQRPAANTPNEVSKLISAPLTSIAFSFAKLTSPCERTYSSGSVVSSRGNIKRCNKKLVISYHRIYRKWGQRFIAC